MVNNDEFFYNKCINKYPITIRQITKIQSKFVWKKSFSYKLFGAHVQNSVIKNYL